MHNKKRRCKNDIYYASKVNKNTEKQRKVAWRLQNG